MTKILVTVEIEFSDLPSEAREDLADGLNFRADEDTTLNVDLDPVPTLADYSVDDLMEATMDFFRGLDDYETQAEMWAGSDFYAYISDFKVLSAAAA